jgi:hypothetical protein
VGTYSPAAPLCWPRLGVGGFSLCGYLPPLAALRPRTQYAKEEDATPNPEARSPNPEANPPIRPYGGHRLT